MFLYRRQHVLSKDICKEFIHQFDKSPDKKSGVVGSIDNSGVDGGRKKSLDLSLNPSYLVKDGWKFILTYLVTKLEQNLSLYMERYDRAFINLDPLEINPVFNIQKYEAGEAFYGWHCERASENYGERVLVWMIYLNTITTGGGETEFLFQNHHEHPEEGKLLIWPSDWTHLHRGVPTEKDPKYILTGWFTFQQKK